MIGCAGVSRSCSSDIATSFGGDWIIVQFGAGGLPFNCWKLPNTSVTNEQGSDGVYWLAPDGHLVHISGWYNRVQVDGGRWEQAAKSVGVELAKCAGGAYGETTNNKEPAQ